MEFPLSLIHILDELVMSDRLRQRKSAEETLADLRHGHDDEDQQLWLRRYHQAVSYTHLDVYKRQQLPHNQPIRFIAVCCECSCICWL